MAPKRKASASFLRKLRLLISSGSQRQESGPAHPGTVPDPDLKSYTLLQTACLPVPRVTRLFPRTSTNTTKPRTPRTELAELSRWLDFDEKCREFLEKLPNTTISNAVHFRDLRADTSARREANVNMVLERFLFGPVRFIAGALGMDGMIIAETVAPQVLLNPDFIFQPTDTDKARVCIEVKTPWTLDVDDLIAAHGAQDANATKAIQQIYGYMSVNHHRYGVLTTLDRTWFLKRGDTLKALQVAGPFRAVDLNGYRQGRLDGELSPIAALLFLICEARKGEHFYVSPVTSAQSNPKLETWLQGDKYQPSIVSLNSSLFKLEQSLPEGVVEGKLHEDESVITVVFKMVDSGDKDKILQLQKEAGVYKKLESLQGTTIPRFYRFLEIPGLASFLALEPRGKRLEKGFGGKMLKKMRALVAKVHAAGYLHGDIALRNFVVDKRGSPCLIDFGCASPKPAGPDGDAQAAKEMEQVSFNME